VGTDGHRLSFTSTELKQNYEKQDVILPRKTVVELIKLLDDSDDEVQIELASNQVNFSFANLKLISFLLGIKTRLVWKD
jgi:DNA polymerase-3 subunit beta